MALGDNLEVLGLATVQVQPSVSQIQNCIRALQSLRAQKRWSAIVLKEQSFITRLIASIQCNGHLCSPGGGDDILAHSSDWDGIAQWFPFQWLGTASGMTRFLDSLDSFELQRTHQVLECACIHKQALTVVLLLGVQESMGSKPVCFLTEFREHNHKGEIDVTVVFLYALW